MNPKNLRLYWYFLLSTLGGNLFYQQFRHKNVLFRVKSTARTMWTICFIITPPNLIYLFRTRSLCKYKMGIWDNKATNQCCAGCKDLQFTLTMFSHTHTQRKKRYLCLKPGTFLMTGKKYLWKPVKFCNCISGSCKTIMWTKPAKVLEHAFCASSQHFRCLQESISPWWHKNSDHGLYIGFMFGHSKTTLFQVIIKS